MTAPRVQRGLDQQETFRWMVEELQRLREENTRLAERVVALTLENARASVKPIVEREAEGENITSEIMDFRMRSS